MRACERACVCVCVCVCIKIKSYFFIFPLNIDAVLLNDFYSFFV